MTTGHYICNMKRKIFREDILKVGQELMFTYGYNATGIKQITEAIEIPKGSFYNHFENKEAFALEMLQNYCNRGVLLHKNSLINTGDSPVARLKNMYLKIISNYKEHLEFKKGCIMSNFSTELSDINEKFRVLLDTQFKEIETLIGGVLKEAQEKKEINPNLDIKTTSSFILNSWHGAIVRMKTTANQKPLDDFVNLIFNNILI